MDLHSAVFIRAMFVIISVFYYRGSRDGIQPERLNAEGEARVLLAGGGALAQPPEYMPSKEKRLKDAKIGFLGDNIRVLLFVGMTIFRGLR